MTKPHVTPEYLASQGLSPTFEDRFWDKVFILTYDRGCWLRIASQAHLYGQIGRWKVNDRPMQAHRASWILHFGPIPSGMRVLHKCDNPPCVRPDHLFLGTAKDNTTDMINKGRFVLGYRGKGEEVGTSKLTTDNVSKIKALRTLGHSQQEIADMFGVCQSTIGNVVRGVYWRHAQGKFE